MTEQWVVEVLVRPGGFDGHVLVDVFQVLTSAGFVAGYQNAEGVDCISGDGAGSLDFFSGEAAMRWLSESDGLVPFRLPDTEMEFGLSAHRAHGVLQAEMVGRPDEAILDVLAITTSINAAESAHSQATWKATLRFISCVVNGVSAELAIGLSEAMRERLSESLCLHRRLVGGRLPPLVGWYMAAPLDSPSGRIIEEMGEATGLDVGVELGHTTLQLEPWPTVSSFASVLEATATWREVSRDVDC